MIPPLCAIQLTPYALSAPGGAYSGVEVARRWPEMGQVIHHTCGSYADGKQSAPIGYRADGGENRCSMRGVDDSTTTVQVWKDWLTVNAWKGAYIRPPTLEEQASNAACEARSRFLLSRGFKGVVYDALAITAGQASDGTHTPAAYQAFTDKGRGLDVGLEGGPSLPGWSAWSGSGLYHCMSPGPPIVPDWNGLFRGRLLWLQGSEPDRLALARAGIRCGLTPLIDLGNIAPADVDELYAMAFGITPS